MTRDPVSDVPERLGRLPDSVAGKVLKPSVLRGAPLQQSLLVSGSMEPADDSKRWGAAEIRTLIDDAMDRFEGVRPTVSDAWLAPRLHHTLRMTRVEATDSALWNFIALRVAPDYVRWRWGQQKDGRSVVGQTARFSGRWDLQSLSRLWWAAEMFRDGDDYRPVEIACANQDVLNYAMRLEMNHHRPSALALVRLLEKGVVRTGRDVNGFSKAAGAAGSTLMYEAIAPDEPKDHEALQDWIHDESSGTYQLEALPLGPDDGAIPPPSVERLVEWFETLFETAPVRGKEADEETPDLSS